MVDGERCCVRAIWRAEQLHALSPFFSRQLFIVHAH